MGLHVRIACVLVFLCAAPAPSFGQTCAGAPSFAHYTWRTTIGLEVVEGGLLAGTSLAGGRDALFGSALVTAGHSKASRGAAFIVGGAVGSDRLVHRGRRVHLCPTVTGFYTIGPDQALPVNPAQINTPLRIDVSSVSVGAGGTIGFVAHETKTRQILPTASVAVMRERTRATQQGERFPDLTESFLLARLGLGFVFNDETAITPQLVLTFRDRSTTSLHIVGTFAFGIR